VLAILFIFYGLYLIKKENSGYQSGILEKSEDLLEKNEEIQAQKDIIEEKATLLAAQKEELVELNSLKNKLFSVIAHDLKSPMYALRNLFHNVQQHNVPEQDVREIVPLVVNDLNYTIGLMENLLQWAKTQMSADTVNTQKVDVSGLIQEVMKLLRLQADAKQIYVEQKIDLPVFVSADKDMINLVLRNLLSNAIKFTAPRGQISLGINEHSSFVEIYVQDSGTGITSEELEKIKSNNYYSTNGTASESGTGLGLMLCKDFLARHGGQMYIESQPGKGSTFSFTLPRQA
jgi:signal transduction histidine kinase